MGDKGKAVIDHGDKGKGISSSNSFGSSSREGNSFIPYIPNSSPISSFGSSSREGSSSISYAANSSLSSNFGSSSREGSAFLPYTPTQEPSIRPFWPSSLQIAEKKSVVSSLTTNLRGTYRRCNPEFFYPEGPKHKRYLTNPSEAVLNDGHDNKNSDLILFINLELVNARDKRKYIVKEMLGQGTFGQVVKCWSPEADAYLAVKVIKNQPAYSQQARVEVSILTHLNTNYDPEDKNHIVRIFEYFEHHGHLCIVFEMLGSNLYDLIKISKFKGFPLSLIQSFAKQILTALSVLKEAAIIHCDLKPENVLVCAKTKPPLIKVIDFGSACRENKTVYSYIQSRYYRSPEVLLGCPYTTAIDMWSFGCLVVELFLGLPIFPGASEYDLMKRMMETLCSQPPDDMLAGAKYAGKFFNYSGGEYIENQFGVRSTYQAISEEEYEAKELVKPQIGKRYFRYTRLDEVIIHYPVKSSLTPEELLEETSGRMALIDFLRGLIQFEPSRRWTPAQALNHPFVTGETLTGPYVPLEETPRIPVYRPPVHVDHNPAVGHWLGTGLSPQVVEAMNNQFVPFYNNTIINNNNNNNGNSPHFPRMPHSYSSSYGSIGSHGSSYNENGNPAGLGTSYGTSYGNNNPYFPPMAGRGGFNVPNQVGGTFLGASPIVNRVHLPYNNGNGGLGVSPSNNLGQMSLGASPSQFTPPNAQHSHFASPGKYGPISPGRNGMHGHSYEHGRKTQARSNLSSSSNSHQRRRGGGLPASVPPHYDHGSLSASPLSYRVPPNGYGNNMPSSYHDGGASSSLHHHHYNHHHYGGGGGYSQSNLSNASASSSSSHHNNWRPPVGAGGGAAGTGRVTVISKSNPNTEVNNEGVDAPAPNPADWDPNYSEELLLQEPENTDAIRPLTLAFNNGMQIGGANNAPPNTSTRIPIGYNNSMPTGGGPIVSPNNSTRFIPNGHNNYHRYGHTHSGQAPPPPPPPANYASLNQTIERQYRQVNNNRQHNHFIQQERFHNQMNNNIPPTATSSTASSSSFVHVGILPQNGRPQVVPSSTMYNTGNLQMKILGQRGGHNLDNNLPPKDENGQM